MVALVQIICVLAFRVVRCKLDLDVSDADAGIVYHNEAVSPFV